MSIRKRLTVPLIWVVAGLAGVAGADLFLFRPRVVEFHNASQVRVSDVTVGAFFGRHTAAQIEPGETVHWSFRGISDMGLTVARREGRSDMKIDAMADVIEPGATYVMVEINTDGKLRWRSRK